MLAVPVGLLATAILMVNNTRDLETDRRAGKKTLAVRLGRERARLGYALLIYLAFVTAPLAWALRRRAPDAVAAAAVAGAAARGADRPGRPQPRRRPVAQRRAGQAPACSSSRSASCSPSGSSSRADGQALGPDGPVRASRAAPGVLGRDHRARDAARPARPPRRPLRRGRGRAAGALRRRLDRRRASRARRLRGRALRDRADRRRARRLPGRARPPPGARRDRHGALGPRLAPHEHAAGEADPPARGRRGRGQRHDRRRRPRGRGRPPPPRRCATAFAA